MVNSVGRHLEEAAYLAGLIDGGGSIYVRLKSQKSSNRKQVVVAVTAVQKSDKMKFLENLQKLWKVGKIRIRKDGMVEWYIQKRKEVKELLEIIFPYLKLKKPQAALCLELVNELLQINELNFDEIEKIAIKIAKMNLSKKNKLLQMSP
jgi:hypothetical protein